MTELRSLLDRACGFSESRGEEFAFPPSVGMVVLANQPNPGFGKLITFALATARLVPDCYVHYFGHTRMLTLVSRWALKGLFAL